MAAPRGFPTLLPLTNDTEAGEVVLHKVTRFLDLGDIITTALRYFGVPVTLLFDPVTLTSYILTDSDDRDSVLGVLDGEAYRTLQPVSGQTGTNLLWEVGAEDGAVSTLDVATAIIVEPQLQRRTIGGLLNTVHVNSPAFTLTDQNTGTVRLIVPSDAEDLSARIAAIGFSGAGKRVVVKLNPPTPAAF